VDDAVRFPKLTIHGDHLKRNFLFGFTAILTNSVRNKKFELMLTRRAKAYSSSGSVVTHRSTNRARRTVTSFQSKRVTNYATPPTPVPWRHLVQPEIF